MNATLVCLIVIGAASMAPAATFTVTNTNNSGAGSFRQAILDANGAAGADTIAFDTAGTFSTSQTIALANRIQITGPLTIDAPSSPARRVTLDGGNANAHLFFNTSNATLTVQNLKFVNGSGTNSGAIEAGGSPASLVIALNNCIFQSCTSAANGGAVNGGNASVTATDCSFTSCSAVNGAAIDTATITMDGCSVKSCTASGSGVLDYTSLTASNCEIDSCTANGSANARLLQGDLSTLRQTSLTRNTTSGLFPYKSSTPTNDLVLLESCTISGNNSAIRFSQLARLMNCTVANNSAALEGSRVRVVQSAFAGFPRVMVDQTLLTMGNCIVSANGAGADLKYPYISLGGNVIGRLNTGYPDYTPSNTADLRGTVSVPVDPLLQALAANGGVGDTHKPGAGSPAIGYGVDRLWVEPDYSTPLKDQVGNDRLQGSHVDSGAVERQQNFVVTNTSDTGTGSLRQMVADAAAESEALITFSDGTFGSGTGIITLASTLTLANPISIIGPDAGVKIRGGALVRVFEVTAASGTIGLENLWIADGRAGTGPGLHASGAAHVVMRNCLISNHVATSGAGAVHAQGGYVSATNCLFATNLAETSGGAAAASSGGKFHATNSTFTGNSAKVNGGAIQAFSSGEVRLVNCTVSGNTADSDANNTGDGGGLGQLSGGTFAVGNSIVSGNFDSSTTTIDPDIFGTFTSLGFNLVSRQEGLNLAGGTPFQHGVNGDLVGTLASPVQPLLNSLTNNGGLLATFKPQAASPCVNAGSASLLNDAAWPERPEYDARTQFREIFAPDIGAVEAGDVPFVKIVPGTGLHQIKEFNGEEGSLLLLRSLPTAALDVTVDLAGASTAETSDFTLSGSNLIPVTSTRWTAHFNAGIQSKYLRVTGIDDDLEDPAETVVLQATLAAGYFTISSPVADRTITLLDDDLVVTNTNGSGPGSFVDEVAAANVLPYPGKVSFDPTIFTSGHYTITPDSQLPSAMPAMTIQGPTREGVSVTLNGSVCHLLMQPEDGTHLTIRDLNFTAFDSSVIFASPNFITPYGIELLFERCSFHGNHGFGAVMISSTVELTAINCTFSGNSSTGNGGAISLIPNPDQPELDFPGGLTLEHCTITANVANSDNSPLGLGGGIGGGIYHDSGDYSQSPAAPAAPALFALRPLKVKNCIIAQNVTGTGGSTTVTDVTGGFASLGGNQIGSSNGSYAVEEIGQVAAGAAPNYGLFPAAWRLSAPLDLFGSSGVPSNPLLLALDFHGGHTRVCLPQALSPTIGLASGNSTTLTDQRGLIRDASPDAGAVEVGFESYAQWRNRLLTATTLTARLDDPDGDGLVNQIEWQTGTDPNLRNSPALGLQRVGNNWQVSFSRSLLVDPSTLKLQTSEDLATWTNVAYPASGLSSTTSSEAFSQLLPASSAVPPRKFARLKVTDP